MLTHKKMRSDAPGTRYPLEQYGSQWVCVRYRYDEARRTRRKTRELLPPEVPWDNPAARLRAEEIVGLRIRVQETNLQHRIRLAGGKWNPIRRVWELRDDQTVRLQLTDRIELQNASHHRNTKVSGIRK